MNTFKFSNSLKKLTLKKTTNPVAKHLNLNKPKVIRSKRKYTRKGKLYDGSLNESLDGTSRISVW